MDGRSTRLEAASLCPCGDEPLDTGCGFHAIGVSCRERVVRHVRRRFGPHRFGGRYAAEVEDIVQECFRNLLVPSGLGSFVPDVQRGRKRNDAFRAWLWRLVHNHCNNKADYFERHQEVLGRPLETLPQSRAATTPEQAFAQTRLRDLNEQAVGEVERCWRSKGQKWGERFEVVLSLLYEQEADTQRARARLGINDVHLRQLKWKLAQDLRCRVREQVREDLVLDAGCEGAVVEREIDREIEALFQTAYPGSSVWSLLLNDGEAVEEFESEFESERQDEPVETMP